jgi:ketosteroid isomerase-like protein
LKALLTVWVRGDRAALNNLLADDLRWTVIGSSPVSGRYNSKREFLEGPGARMAEKLATPIQPTLRHVIADGNMVALVFDGRANGKNGTDYTSLLLGVAARKWQDS